MSRTIAAHTDTHVPVPNGHPFSSFSPPTPTPSSLSTSTFGTTKDFLIKDIGAWTKAFGQCVAEGSKQHEGPGPRPRVKVSGPYFAPTMLATTEDRALLVATGIGITPFLSIVHHTIFKNAAMAITAKVTETVFGQPFGVTKADIRTQRQSTISIRGQSTGKPLSMRVLGAADDAPSELHRNHKHGKSKEVLLIWAVRETSLVAFFLRYLAVMLTSHMHTDPNPDDGHDHTTINVHLYFTGLGAQKNFASIAYNTFMQVRS